MTVAAPLEEGLALGEVALDVEVGDAVGGGGGEGHR